MRQTCWKLHEKSAKTSQECMSVVPPATQSKHMQENNTMSSSNGGAALGTTQPIDTTFIM